MARRPTHSPLTDSILQKAISAGGVGSMMDDAPKQGDTEACQVNVFVRVRPFGPHELAQNPDPKCIVKMTDTSATVYDTKEKKWHEPPFYYDGCFWSLSKDRAMEPSTCPAQMSQLDVYNRVGRWLVDNLMAGFNTCLLAYGQTGSGKTFTMMGDPKSEEMRGITPRLCEDLLGRIAAINESGGNTLYKLEVSFVEIYNEKVRDLFVKTGKAGSGGKELKVRQHPTLGPYVDGLSARPVSTTDEILRLIDEGNEERCVAATKMNAHSSRSHAVFMFLLSQKIQTTEEISSTKNAKLNMVDLAGSERSSKTGITNANDPHFKEMIKINQSLSTLARVIDALVQNQSGKKPVTPPYRESMLTWILSDSLGGNSKSAMVAAVSPFEGNFGETLSTLRYAARARKIVCKAVVNEDASARMIRELQTEVAQLRKMLHEGVQGAGGSGGESSPRPGAISDEELEELLKKLQLSEQLVEDMEARTKNNSLQWEIAAKQKELELEATEEEKLRLRKELEALQSKLEESSSYQENKSRQLQDVLDQLSHKDRLIEEHMESERALRQQVEDKARELQTKEQEILAMMKRIEEGGSPGSRSENILGASAGERQEWLRKEMESRNQKLGYLSNLAQHIAPTGQPLGENMDVHDPERIRVALGMVQELCQHEEQYREALLGDRLRAAMSSLDQDPLKLRQLAESEAEQDRFVKALTAAYIKRLSGIIRGTPEWEDIIQKLQETARRLASYGDYGGQRILIETTSTTTASSSPPSSPRAALAAPTSINLSSSSSSKSISSTIPSSPRHHPMEDQDPERPLMDGWVCKKDWIQDKQVHKCMNPKCDTKFGITSRRHHCRRCGKLYCSKHVSRKVLVGDHNVAVCDECFPAAAAQCAGANVGNYGVVGVAVGGNSQDEEVAVKMEVDRYIPKYSQPPDPADSLQWRLAANEQIMLKEINSMKSGWAFKLGQTKIEDLRKDKIPDKQQKWNKRYFVLDWPFLYYFHSDRPAERCNGCIYLREAAWRSAPHDKMTCIHISSCVPRRPGVQGGAVFTMAFPDQDTCSSWVDYITATARSKTRRGGLPDCKWGMGQCKWIDHPVHNKNYRHPDYCPAQHLCDDLSTDHLNSHRHYPLCPLAMTCPMLGQPDHLFRHVSLTEWASLRKKETDKEKEEAARAREALEVELRNLEEELELMRSQVSSGKEGQDQLEFLIQGQTQIQAQLGEADKKLLALEGKDPWLELLMELIGQQLVIEAQRSNIDCLLNFAAETWAKYEEAKAMVKKLSEKK